jgi:hypothetical protein
MGEPIGKYEKCFAKWSNLPVKHTFIYLYKLPSRHVVRAQMLTELEEVIEFKELQHENDPIDGMYMRQRTLAIRDNWKKR